MEDELKWEWGISKVSVIRSSFETFSLSFHEVSEVMRNSEIEFVQSKSTDLLTLIHLEWPFGRSRAGKWHSGVFHHPPRAPSYWCQARHMALPVHPTQHMERNNILQELTKNKGQASTLTCALLLAQKGPERGGRSRASGDRALGACDPGEQEDTWEGLDLQGRAWAALGVPSLADAIAWEAFRLQALHDHHDFLQRGFPECCCVPCTTGGAPSSLPAMRRWISPGLSLGSVWSGIGGAPPSWASGTALPDPVSTLQPALLFFPLALCLFLEGLWLAEALLMKETLGLSLSLLTFISILSFWSTHKLNLSLPFWT